MQPRTFRRTEPGSLGHYWRRSQAASVKMQLDVGNEPTAIDALKVINWGRSQAASDILKTEPGSLGRFEDEYAQVGSKM